MSHRDGITFPADTATEAIEPTLGLALLNERPEPLIDYVDLPPHTRVLHRRGRRLRAAAEHPIVILTDGHPGQIAERYSRHS
jgi:hypothetical protein